MNLRDKNDILRFLIHKIGNAQIKNKAVDLANQVRGVLGIASTPYKDEDDMSSDSDTHLATQQSIKAYVDTRKTKRIWVPFNIFRTSDVYTYCNHAYGHIVDSANDMVYWNCLLPDDCNSVTSITVWAAAKAAGAAGKYMGIAGNFYGGALGEDLIIANTFAFVDKLTTTHTHALREIIKWEFTSSDDATYFGNITAGDLLNARFFYEAPVGQDDTNAHMSGVEVIYT